MSTYCRSLLKIRTLKAEIKRMSSTIFALSSGLSRCAVAMIRVSGPDSKLVLSQIARFKKLPSPRKAFVRKIVHPSTNEHLDTGIVLWFPSPNSYTGEDSCELHLHGSPAVVKAVLNALENVEPRGCLRHAMAGEFTRRAYLNGKLDLCQVEGLADLLQAQTDAQRVQALRNVDGHLSRLSRTWAEKLTQCVARLEAFIDFSEEHADVAQDNTLETARQRAQELAKELEAQLGDGRRGERLRAGVRVALLGRPNAGKSSIFNMLCRREAAIVSPKAGTTRDIVEASLDIAGFPVQLGDTAGLSRRAKDPVERKGVARARSWAATSDLLLLVGDCRRGVHELEQLSATLPADLPRLAVLNKCDLLEKEDLQILAEKCQTSREPFLLVSCRTGSGVPELVKALAQQVAPLCSSEATAGSLISERQQRTLGQCLESVQQATLHEEPDIMAEYLRRALVHLGHLVGHVSTEDLLDRIFRDFCVGK
ncbi:tRNA modification GTPase GTPBP3, mitochondrial-like [Ornithodoros turicata]|uniref:tRNA modification GTPase GTPBP3, mitochondrial-like n=1 Tax=Ornithodoros turicata TaxID=34597 RepID=UPI003138969B